MTGGVWVGGRLHRTVATTVLGAPSGEGPKSEVGHRGLLMAAGLDPLSLMDHFKFIHVDWTRTFFCERNGAA